MLRQSSRARNTSINPSFGGKKREADNFCLLEIQMAKKILIACALLLATISSSFAMEAEALC